MDLVFSMLGYAWLVKEGRGDHCFNIPCMFGSDMVMPCCLRVKGRVRIVLVHCLNEGL